MPWNPEIYNQFKNIRFKPFFDIADLIKDEKQMKVVDFGCGTGEQTAILVEKFPQATFLGVDSSVEMLEKSKAFESDRLHFRKATTEEVLDSDESWDLIFSNAALQWSDDHQNLFPKLISKLKSNGQLAVQMPYQPGNILNKILFEMANEEPFRSHLDGWNRPSAVLTVDEYAQILFDNGIENLDISQKVYPIIAEDHETLFNFISGSALIPYLERLNEEQQNTFITEFKQRIAKGFPTLPAIYSFKRILLYGRKINIIN
ncbi:MULTISPECIES: methyltransferase domain-containing protein [Chryseobacterium]|uniref:Trans-aconitate 2-methyltransferase n=1 Tax=Chryseobacterium geocarposphaerae TaxID=1416776 RepID=A0ABU1LB83_9FLAO|nr:MULTISPECIES: methyltransferase domain-containing protein [Chryseobacterium]MDR6403959.1 trans-aconitate 2-methyltransferase [Chryseobacterium geocarposphaerae]MDR6698522.1 trans-aconitate 2-methyltransferase [Chryseobacterium ginsenosidimutans]